MNSYLVHFAVYSFAMVGFIVAVLFVYKKSMYSGNKDKGFLSVENTLKLSPCKTLYVIKAGNERFLIAGDTSSTAMLSKLERDSDYTDFEYCNKSEKVSDISSLKKLTRKISRG